MANAIVYALKEIKWNIPIDVLNKAMNIGLPKHVIDNTSLDEKIISKVIRGKVLLDLNISNGIDMVVFLDGIEPIYDSEYNAIYIVPKERTNGREMLNTFGIGTVLQRGYANSLDSLPTQPVTMHGRDSTCTRSNYMTRQGARVYNSYKAEFRDFNPNTELIGPNTFRVTGAAYYTGQLLGVKCTIENDDNLNNLHTKAYRKFADLCIMATKAFVYRELIIRIGSGELEGGQDLGAFASVVERYDSAIEDYNTYIEEKWGKTAWSNDRNKMNRLIALQLVDRH